MLPIAWQMYQSRSRKFSAQRLMNFYAEMGTQSTKSQILLYGRPGLSLFSNVGSGVIRGVHVMNGIPYVVSGLEVYTLNKFGGSTMIGTVTGTDKVVMADNGFQVCIVGDSKGWIATASSVDQITDSSFRQPSSVVFIDTYFIFSEVNTGILFRSNPLNGLLYDGLDWATAEYGPDNLIRVFASHSKLVALGENTIEFWQSTGALGLSYAPIKGTSLDKGCMARDSVVTIEETFMFLGTGKDGGRTVYRMNGFQAVPVSTPPLEEKWDDIESPENAYAFAFKIEGHAFYVLTFPNEGTYVYDILTGLWSEWQTKGREDWIAFGFINAFNKRLVGDNIGNKVMSLNLDIFNDLGENIIGEAISAPLSSDNNYKMRHKFITIDAETGVGNSNIIDPQIMLSWADEDGKSFNNWKFRSLGKIGETKKRIRWGKLGRSRSRTYKIRITDQCKRIILGAYLDSSVGYK